VRVNGTDLDLWARTTDAQDRFPELVRRLVLATSAPQRVEFRAGEGTQLGGWDGFTQVVTGNAYLPDGVAGWEVSAREDTTTKANQDFSARTADPGGLNRTASTFVFATPRRWAARQNWERDKNESKQWLDVRALDADSLEGWLMLAPGVDIWLSRHLNKLPSGVLDLEGFWQTWASATAPPLTTEVVMAGRDLARRSVEAWLAGGPQAIGIKSETPDESLAFFAAVVVGLNEEDRTRILSRTVLVSDVEDWRQLVFTREPLYLVARMPESAEAAAAVAQGHHVLFPFPRHVPTDESVVELERPTRDAAFAALQAAGLEEGRAQQLAWLAGRSLSALRREIAIMPAALRPAWAEPAPGRALLPAILAGRWDDSSPSDVEVLSQLASRDYAQVHETMAEWSSRPDPPVARVGSKWLVTARLDSWKLLAGYLTSHELSGLRDQSVAVIGEVDPQYELPPEQRYAASIYGKVTHHSSDLRHGIAETVALLGAVGGVGGARSGQDWACEIVHRLLDTDEWTLWASISPLLSQLAEACPVAFLEAVDRALSANPCPLVSLFVENVGLFTSSPHMHLVSALQLLAKSQDFLAEASAFLARLTELAPGGIR
jgi:hypothetical protein